MRSAHTSMGEGGSENIVYASKAPKDPHLVTIQLKILDCVTTLDRTNIESSDVSGTVKTLNAS